MFKYYRLSKPCVAFILSLSTLTETTQAIAFSLPPRLSVNAYSSDYTVGEADLMLPMAGDRLHNFYLDPNIAYGTDNQGYADLGLGYRWIKNEAAILGFYLFGGYTRIDNNARLWVANPGIEALGSRWDAHLNGYITMGDRNQTLGNVQRFYFTGHSEFTDLIQLSQYAGNGADIKLGYQLFPQSSLKGYVGSYFFNPSQTSNIWGGAAGLEYWMDSNVKVFASYTYDNLRHSTGAFGLGIEFGGTHTERITPTLEERITDPVERYLAELGRGSAIPSRLNTQPIPGSSQLLFNNIAFFSQTGGPNNGGIGLTLANCTFENPCGPSDFTQIGVNTLNSLLPNTAIFFNAGTYPASNSSSALILNNGQGVFGRTANYSAPASGAARPTFNGAFTLIANNTLDSIILNNSLGVTTPESDKINNAPTVFSNGGSNILINNSNIGNVAIPGPAIFLKGGASAKLTRSNISSTTPPSVVSPVSPSGAGVINLSSSSLVVESSSVNLVDNLVSSTSTAYAIFLSNNSFMKFNASQIRAVDTLHSITTPPLAVGGVRVADTSFISIENGSNISVTSLASSAAFYSADPTRIQVIVNNSSVAVSGDNNSVIVFPPNWGYVTFGSGASCMLNSIAIVCA